MPPQNRREPVGVRRWQAVVGRVVPACRRCRECRVECERASQRCKQQNVGLVGARACVRTRGPSQCVVRHAGRKAPSCEVLARHARNVKVARLRKGFNEPESCAMSGSGVFGWSTAHPNIASAAAAHAPETNRLLSPSHPPPACVAISSRYLSAPREHGDRAAHESQRVHRNRQERCSLGRHAHWQRWRVSVA